LLTRYSITTAVLYTEKGGTILCELLDSKGTLMQNFIIFTSTDIFISFKPSFAYFNYRNDFTGRKTYLTNPPCRSIQKDSNELWFAFFRVLDNFLCILEV
jgi:hypothetical protein